MDYGLSHDSAEGEEEQRSKKMWNKIRVALLFTTPVDSWQRYGGYGDESKVSVLLRTALWRYLHTLIRPVV